MAILPRINVGQVSNDGQGDRPRVVGEKINEAFTTLESLVDPSPAIAAANQAAGSAQSAAESLEAIGNSLEAGEAAAAAAELSAQNAATSETNAATSETNAATSAGNAATSEGNAATSAGNAATSETNAAGSAGTATTQAGIATTQASIATTQAGIATTQAGNAATSAGNAATSETNAAAVIGKLSGTSATSLAISTGLKTLTTQAGKDFNPGTHVYLVSAADDANTMFAHVDDYVGTALDLNVLAVTGSGTHADWIILGRAGPRGATASGSGDVEGPASSAAGNLSVFGDTTGKLIADSGVAVSTDGALTSNSDAKVPTEKATRTYALPLSYLDTDAALAGDSDTKVASQKATKAYVDANAASAANIAARIHAASGKATPVDADELGLIDSAASNALKKLTWANLKTTLIAAFKAGASGFWAAVSDITFLTPKTIADAGAWVSISSATTLNTDAATGQNFVVAGLDHNATVAAPTNLIDGKTYTWLFKQGSTGGTLAFNSIFVFPSAPTASVGAGKYDICAATYYAADSKLIARFSKGS